VTVASQSGTVDVIYLALVRAGSVDKPPDDDRYRRQVHASFRLRHGVEGVMLVDPPWGRGGVENDREEKKL
jgi:hypothetical protein